MPSLPPGTSFRASSVAKNIKLIHDMLCVGSEENLQYLDTFLDYVTSFLINLADRLFTSRKSKYYKRNVEKDMPEFLVAKLYRIADILSYITPNPKTGSGRHNDSSRMSLLLQFFSFPFIWFFVVFVFVYRYQLTCGRLTLSFFFSSSFFFLPPDDKIMDHRTKHAHPSSRFLHVCSF